MPDVEAQTPQVFPDIPRLWAPSQEDGRRGVSCIERLTSAKTSSFAEKLRQGLKNYFPVVFLKTEIQLIYSISFPVYKLVIQNFYRLYSI